MSYALEPLPHGPDAPSFRCEPYEPSIASSASSSQVSVFSDAVSNQSSVASSISDDFRLTHDEVRDRACAQTQLYHQAHIAYAGQLKSAPVQAEFQKPATYAHITSIPAEQRQNPRRCSLAKHQRPPPLVRQCERKTHFVDNLVDSATQMVEVIWPISVAPCHGENGSGRAVLPLRTYIEETLRRSRTSYSTLQVALYYLVLIRPHVPCGDFTKEQSADCAALRALMCGRRMFLASLILASKYLQDRNYSAKAWSKMSGLKVCEINSNERTFLSKVSWKLHIPETIFKRWTDVVLRYTPTQPSSPADELLMHGGDGGISWKQVIPMLTPELDRLPIADLAAKPNIHCPANYGFGYASVLTSPKGQVPPTTMPSTSQESTPTPATVAPRLFCAQQQHSGPPTPALIRMGPLPTPQLTPSSVASSTPAASACSSRRPSISSAMSFAQQASFNRCTTDAYPLHVSDLQRFSTRRPSVTSMSSTSSPESLMSDRSRFSRSSSISSTNTVSTNLSAAVPQSCLARLATCRNARLPQPAVCRRDLQYAQAQLLVDGISADKPITIADSDTEMTSSPPDFAAFSISEKKAHMPHRHSKSAVTSNSTTIPTIVGAQTEKPGGKKRARPRGGRRSNLQAECRILYEEELDAMAEAEIEADKHVASPSPASHYATRMLLSRGDSISPDESDSKQLQPPSILSKARDRANETRVPVQKNDGKKRTCCSGSQLMEPSASAWSIGIEV